MVILGYLFTYQVHQSWQRFSFNVHSLGVSPINKDLWISYNSINKVQELNTICTWRIVWWSCLLATHVHSLNPLCSWHISSEIQPSFMVVSIRCFMFSYNFDNMKCDFTLSHLWKNKRKINLQDAWKLIFNLKTGSNYTRFTYFPVSNTIVFIIFNEWKKKILITTEY